MGKKQKYTFKEWCQDNNRESILERWDYEKTGFGPEDITYASNKDVFIKCPAGIHESSKRKVWRLTNKNSDQVDFKCIECLNGHSHNFEDLAGVNFGELTVLKLDNKRNEDNKNSGNNQTYWLCKCSCGSVISTYSIALKYGKQTTCGNRAIHKSGENSSNWKGGITPKLLSERTSKRYNEWRDMVYKKDWYTCQCCGKSKNINKNAHHIINYAENEELRYDLNNSILLCEECHHIKCIGSFHNIYGTHNNSPEQLEEYINNKRKQLGINIPFNIDEYKKGKILKPNDLIKTTTGIWIFDLYSPNELKTVEYKKNNIQPRFRIKEEVNNGKYKKAS